MNCPSCGIDNLQDAKSCARCGHVFADDHVLTAGPPTDPADSKGLSVASFVLGILSIVPFGPFAGIPAVIFGIVSLVRDRPGRGLAAAGVTLGSVGTVLSVAGVLFAIIIPNYLAFQERARRACVKNNMHVVQTALEAYSVDHFGNLPGADVSWEDEEDGEETRKSILLWFPGGDPDGIDGRPDLGGFPVNPYTGRRYEYGLDLFYFPDTLQYPWSCALVSDRREECPYRGFAAPPDAIPGTMVVLGHTNRAGDPAAPIKYAVVGYGKELTEPLFDSEAQPLEADDSLPGRIYFVLHN